MLPMGAGSWRQPSGSGPVSRQVTSSVSSSRIQEDVEGSSPARQRRCFAPSPPPGAAEGLQAWLGSVCTDVVHRRAGFALATVGTLLQRLDALKVEQVSLNATPEGLSMYESFGFYLPAHPGLRRRRPIS